MEFRYALCRAPWPGREAQYYHRRVDRLRREDLAQLAVAFFGDEEDETVDDVRQTLHTAVDEVLFRERQDVGRLKVRDREFILTGGMSDEHNDPTEAYGWVQLLWKSGVTLVRKPDRGHAARRALAEEVVGMNEPRQRQGLPAAVEAAVLEAVGAPGVAVAPMPEGIQQLMNFLERQEAGQNAE